jgi:hypothetical protein
MNLADILDRKLVENEEDDEAELHGAKQGDIIHKFTKGLVSLLNPIDEEVVGDVIFSESGMPDSGGQHADLIIALKTLLLANGVDLAKPDEAQVIEVFKKMGLTRGEALYVVSMQ